MENDIWAAFDELSNVVHRQGKRVAELEQRIANLEARLNETLKPQEIKEAA